MILQILVEKTNVETGMHTRGKLSLVDLAGSERVAKSGVEGEALKEAIAINKSLTALGDVIEALTKRQRNVPYRNHKLTLLMSDSLGGKSKSLMFVNIAGGNMHVAETLSSLGYAARVKEVVNSPEAMAVDTGGGAQQDLLSMVEGEMERAMEELQQENARNAQMAHVHAEMAAKLRDAEEKEA